MPEHWAPELAREAFAAGGGPFKVGLQASQREANIFGGPPMFFFTTHMSTSSLGACRQRLVVRSAKMGRQNSR